MHGSVPCARLIFVFEAVVTWFGLTACPFFRFGNRRTHRPPRRRYYVDRCISLRTRYYIRSSNNHIADFCPILYTCKRMNCFGKGFYAHSINILSIVLSTTRTKVWSYYLLFLIHRTIVTNSKAPTRTTIMTLRYIVERSPWLFLETNPASTSDKASDQCQ